MMWFPVGPVHHLTSMVSWWSKLFVMVCGVVPSCMKQGDPLAHWGRDQSTAISRTTFSNENVWILIQISLHFVPILSRWGQVAVVGHQWVGANDFRMIDWTFLIHLIFLCKIVGGTQGLIQIKPIAYFSLWYITSSKQTKDVIIWELKSTGDFRRHAAHVTSL